MFTSSGRELEVGVGREKDELSFSSTKFLTVSMFSSFILVRGGPRSLEGEMAAGGYRSVDNFREGVTVRKQTW